MGIDLLKLDFIIHFYPPTNLEQYWQEAGRGGREMDHRKKERCECVLLYAPDDYDKLAGFPNLASFAKTLSTFACAVRGEAWLDEEDIAERGKLRKLLDELRRSKAIRHLPSQRIAGVTFERWKLRKSAGQVVRQIERLLDEESWKTKQTKRLRSNLRIHAARKGNTIRVPQGTAEGGPSLDYYDKELNWFTEPGIDALEMVDVEWEAGLPFTCFHLLKSKLSHDEMSLLARKINAYRKLGYSKLDYVFERFLTAKHGREKDVILKYLNAPKPPV